MMRITKTYLLEKLRKFWKLALALWILKFIVLLVILSYSANAISFNALGWKISWNEQPDIIDEVSNMENMAITTEFNEEIKFINSFKESQLFLKELDYKRIGIIDTSTSMIYTAVIDEDGIISHIEQGLNEPETIIKVNIPKVENAIINNNFIEIKNHIQLPFKVKLKILLMRWF